MDKTPADDIQTLLACADKNAAAAFLGVPGIVRGNGTLAGWTNGGASAAPASFAVVATLDYPRFLANDTFRLRVVDGMTVLYDRTCQVSVDDNTVSDPSYLPIWAGSFSSDVLQAVAAAFTGVGFPGSIVDSGFDGTTETLTFTSSATGASINVIFDYYSSAASGGPITLGEQYASGADAIAPTGGTGDILLIPGVTGQKIGTLQLAVPTNNIGCSVVLYLKDIEGGTTDLISFSGANGMDIVYGAASVSQAWANGVNTGEELRARIDYGSGNPGVSTSAAFYVVCNQYAP